MNPKLKAKWVKALRSGKYKQGRGQLLNTYGEYCCLGVLCKVARIPVTNGDYHRIFEIIGSDFAAEELWRLNDAPEEIPFDVIAGLIDEAL